MAFPISMGDSRTAALQTNTAARRERTDGTEARGAVRTDHGGRSNDMGKPSCRIPIRDVRRGR